MKAGSFFFSKRSVCNLLLLGCAVVLHTKSAWGVGRNEKAEQKIDLMPAASTTAQPAGTRKEIKNKPTLRIEDAFYGFGDQLKATTDAQIKTLQKLIENTAANDPEKPDLLFRMAELYAENGRYYEFKARGMDQSISDATNQNNAALLQTLKADQNKFEKSKAAWQTEAIKKYKEVADSDAYRTYKRMDSVLFYLVQFLYQDKQTEDDAIRYAKRLATEFPEFPSISSVYLTLGNHLFEKENFEFASKFYDKVISGNDPRLVEYAHYKKAWIAFHSEKFLLAFDTFVGIIVRVTDPARKVDPRSEKNNVALLRESRKDMVRTYTYLQTQERTLRPWALCKKYGGDKEAPGLMELLGEIFATQGKNAESIEVYKELIAQLPGSERVCLWEGEVVRNTLAMTGSRATNEMLLAIKNLANANAKLEKISTPAAKESLGECRQRTEETLRDLAITWHREAQKTAVLDTYKAAGEAYQLYLSMFREGRANELLFWYAELLFKLGSLDSRSASPWYCDAAPVFTQVVQQAPKGAKSKDSAFAAVLSWKNCLDVNQEQSTEEAKSVSDAKSSKKTEKQVVVVSKPIPEKWQKFIDSMNTYLTYDPDPNIFYRLAYVYYSYDKFEKAISLFEKVLYGSDAGDQANKNGLLREYSANLLMDALSLLRKQNPADQSVIVEKMAKYASQFANDPGLMKNPEFAEQIRGIQAGITRLQIEAMERNGRFSDAAYAYIALADKNPNDPKLAEILYNAAVNFKRAGKIASAVLAYERLIVDQPSDPLAKMSLFRLGQAYQGLAAYADSAKYYEQFATQFSGELGTTDGQAVSDKNDKIDASKALATAILFRLGLGQVAKAEDNVKLFINNYGRRKDFYDRAASVFFDLGQSYEQGALASKFAPHFQKYIALFARTGGVDRHIVALLKLGKNIWEGSCPVAGINGACIKIERVRATQATAIQEKRNKKALKETRTQCGPATKSKLTLVKRNPAKVAQALRLLQTAFKLYKDGKITDQITNTDPKVQQARLAALQYHVAMARMVLADQEYEKLLAMKVPPKLVFDERKKREQALSVKRFQTWLVAKANKLAETKKMYEKVIVEGNAHWAIAAAARIGQSFQNAADNLYTTPIPVPPKAPPGIPSEEWAAAFQDKYCDQMDEQAQPLEDKAVEALAACLDKSQSLSWFNDWSRLCEQELNQMRPTGYPLATEWRKPPSYNTVPSGQLSVVNPVAPAAPMPPKNPADAAKKEGN